MVFQNYALYPHMSVYENMAFGLMLRKFPKPEIDQRVREAATMLGLTDFLDRNPRELSGGQRQRVAVGRAIVRTRGVPVRRTAVQPRRQAARLVRAEIGCTSGSTTTIYVTHDQIEAMTMGDRIGV